MATYVLWTAFTWTFQGILCTCRFLWICPYNAVHFLQRERRLPEDSKTQLKQAKSPGRRSSAIPGSPERSTPLHRRLAKAERDLLSLRTRVACDRVSWERRFLELQRRQEELRMQLLSETTVCVREGSSGQAEYGVDNGEVFEECSASYSGRWGRGRGSTSFWGFPSSSPASPLGWRPASVMSSSSLGSCRTHPGPHRCFVPHSPMDLQPGHRVRVVLPSGRISTGTVHYLGPLQGAPQLHLGVELETPEQGLQDGRHRGHSYFQCKPGCGAFVPFDKLLMAWE